jgi:hypothetical protein
MKIDTELHITRRRDISREVSVSTRARKILVAEWQQLESASIAEVQPMTSGVA